MARTKRDLEAENEELWQKLEEVYDRLGHFFEPTEDDSEVEEDG